MLHVTILYHFGRISTDDGVWWYIFYDYSSVSYNSSFAYGNITTNRTIGAQPDKISYFYILWDMTLPVWNSIIVIVIMRAKHNIDSSTRVEVVPNFYPPHS